MRKVLNLGVRLPRWLDTRRPPEYLVFGGAAVVVGLMAGAGVWLFKRLIDVVRVVAFERLGGMLSTTAGAWTILLIPALGGLLVGLLMRRFVRRERYHGVAGVIAAVALSGGRLRYAQVPAKALAAAVSIGAGASVGPEDPSIQIGANSGSFVGQALGLSDTRVRALVAAGAAGGIAAAFNAPIAGVFFALEVILGEINSSAFGITVLAAVTAAAFTQAVSGAQPAFSVPPYPFQSALTLPLYFLLGLVAGPVAALYVWLLYAFQDLFASLTRVPRWLKPAIAGLAVGVVGVFLPGIFGVGYDVIGALLNAQDIALGVTIALLVAKLILTPVSIAGGFPGGVFAPALFIGATLGSAFAAIVGRFLPGVGLAAPAFAMVGMAAVLAGAAHAPLTAVMLLFEMTNDYRIILPLLFAVAVSMAVAQRMAPDSVYTLGLARKGIRIERGRDVDVLDALPVSEVMSRVTETLSASDTLSAAAAQFERTHHHGMAVLDANGDLMGLVTLQDLARAAEKSPPDVTVADICVRELLTAFPDESIGAALRRMSVRDVGRLPVVDRRDPRRLLGMLTRAGVIRAYEMALARRTALRHHAGQARLSALTGASTEEFRVEPGSPVAGKQVAEVDWPQNCLIASIRRGSHVLIPRGHTAIEPGDVIVAVLEDDALPRLRELTQDRGRA